jgi:hypothetical protein
MTMRSIFSSGDRQPYRRLSGSESRLLSYVLHSGRGYSPEKIAEITWRLV